MTVTPDWATEMFPGEGTEIPSDAERNRADALIAKWNARWSEDNPPIPRTRGGELTETNRAFLRSHLRRWWAKP